MTIIRKMLVLVALGALALPASAQVLYKLIDKNGKVTYSEKPPKDFDGKVIRMDIDPNANTAVLPKPGSGPTEGASSSKDAEALRRDVQKKSSEEDRVEKARSRVQDAKQRLQDLKDNPGDNDVVRIGNVGGGTRPVPTEEYLARIQRAEAEVKAAEEELARISSGR